AADCRVRLWDVAERRDSRRPRRFPHPTKAMLLDVGFSPDGQYLATGGTDNKVQIWNLQGRLLEWLEGHKGWIMCVVFGPCNRWLASGSMDGSAKIWDQEGREVASFSHFGPVLSVAFSPNNRFLTSGCVDGKIRCWDLEEPARTTPAFEFLSDHGPVWSVRYSPDGERIAAGCQDGSIGFWCASGESIMS